MSTYSLDNKNDSQFSIVSCNISQLSSDRGFHNVRGECCVTFRTDGKFIDSSTVIILGGFTNIGIPQTVADLRFNIERDQNTSPIVTKDPEKCYRSDMTSYFSEWLTNIRSKEDIHWWTAIMIINYVIATGTVDNAKILREIEEIGRASCRERV